MRCRPREFHKEFNKRLGIDDVDARQIGGQRVMDKSHGWQSWEDIFALKQAIGAHHDRRDDAFGDLAHCTRP
jgi:branched-chain amino acid transport system substrate-binding protein